MSYADLEKNRAYQRAYDAKRREKIRLEHETVGWKCKHCGVYRRTSETLRVHEMIAHPEWEA